MRVMVTGAAGALGRRLVSVLAATPRVAEVIAVDRVDDPEPDGRARAHWHLADLLEIDAGELVRHYRPDVVIHLPALSGFAAESAPVQAKRLNVLATLDMARAMLAARDQPGTVAGARPRPMFVFTSSVAAIGAGTDGAAADEGAFCAPTSVYGRHKLAAETALAQLAADSTLDLRVLRLPTLLFRRVARPGRPTTGFISELAREVLGQAPIVVPAPPEFEVAVNSTGVAAHALARLLSLPQASFVQAPLVHLPAWPLTAERLLQALAERGRDARERVRFAPDTELMRLCSRWPRALVSRLGAELDSEYDLDAEARLARLLEGFG